MSEAVRGDNRSLIALHAPLGLAAEAFRMLRTSLDFLGSEQPLSSIVVTSSIPSEGKSLIAANLAIVYMQSGAKTCLVDADLRRSALTREFGCENQGGLTTALVKAKPLREVIVHDLFGLAFVPSGPIPPNPVELLASPRMGRIMADLSSEYDMVIYDMPPLTVVADPTVVAPRTDGVLLVARAGHVRTDQVKAAHALLARNKSRVLGVVLNGVRQSGRDSYGYYGDSRRGRKRGQAV
jgi:capsular exopolysaccharide synthesis family protein